jgi:GTP-binding protein
MTGRLPVLVIVGRPNVGKSTLFNRLTRSRDALVADQPGVTRDRHYGFARVMDRDLIVVDTGGLGVEDENVDRLAARQTQLAIDEADAVLFVVDGRAGLLPGDTAVAGRLRGLTATVHVLVNKAEGQPAEQAAAEFHELGLGEPRAISAEHGDRVSAALEVIIDRLPSPNVSDQGDAATATGPSDSIHLAVLGRPNAGKSTLINRLLGEERMLALDQPGTTRDAIAADFERDGQAFRIVDTAGVRRRARVHDALEKFSVIKALQAVEAAQVTLLVIDAQSGIGAQDARLLRAALERGRGVVIAINKWDGLSDEDRRFIKTELSVTLNFADYLPLCFISALHGSGLGELLDTIRQVHAACFATLSTPALSRALEAAVQAHAPPAVHGRRIKLRYAHQGGRNPPRIVIHGNQTDRLGHEYKRYLTNRFRQAFALQGTPVELVFRSGENPYEHRAGKKNPR